MNVAYAAQAQPAETTYGHYSVHAKVIYQLKNNQLFCHSHSKNQPVYQIVILHQQV